jgi:methylated-DNA-[protein]-cysteine S-methyltransferase
MAARHAAIDTELGELTLVAEDSHLVGVYFPHHWYRPPRSTFGRLVRAADDHLLAEVTGQLSEYLRGARTEFTVSARTRGTPFEEQVWALLREIPYGRTTTYGTLAGELGDRRLAQDVGRAVGRNPLSVIVPCHRVIGANGKLTGYAGGLARKRRLLEIEGATWAEPAAEPASGPAPVLF